MRYFIAGLALLASFSARAESAFPCIPDRQLHAQDCQIAPASGWTELPVSDAVSANGTRMQAKPEQSGRVVSLETLRRDAIWRQETSELLRRILR